MDQTNLVRELQKISDVLNKANDHFAFESKMNAALHLSETVRPTPLGAAVEGALGSIEQVIADLQTTPD